MCVWGIGRGVRLAGSLLLAGVLLTGCVKVSDTDTVNQGQIQPSHQEGQVSVGTGDMADGMLDAQCRFVSMDRRNLTRDDAVLEGVGQLLRLQCLASGTGIYAAGTRKNGETAELAVYKLDREEKPELAVSWPDERLLAWCGTQEGIALVSVRSDKSGDKVHKSFLLRVLEDGGGEGLVETGEWFLDDVFRNQDVSGTAFSAMAMEESRLALVEKRTNRLLTVDFSTEAEPLAVDLAESAEALRFRDGDTLWVLTGRGTLYEVSLLTGSVGTAGERLFNQLGGVKFSAIGDKCIYAGTADGIHAVDINDGQGKTLAKCTMGSGDNASLWMGEGSEEGVAAFWNETSMEVYQYFFMPVSPDPAEGREREVIILESYGVGEDLVKAARQFNQSNDLYQVEIVEGKDGEDAEAYWTRYDTRLTTGEGPDLIVLREDKVKTYLEKGVLEDLAHYIWRDLNPDDYIESALYAFQHDGFVYAIGSTFSLSVMVTEKSWVDMAGGVGLFDVFRMAEESGMSVFMENEDKNRLLYWCLEKLGSGIYDMGKVKECILFADKFGEDFAQDGVQRTIGIDVVAKMEYIRSPLDIPDIERYYARRLEEVAIMGIPLEQEACFLFDFSMSPLGINAASKHKEGAWAFIQYMLGEEYQYSQDDTYNTPNHFPVRKDVFDAMVERYSAPKTYDVYIEELGEIITVTAKHSLRRCMQDFQDYEVEALTEEQLQRFRKMVNQAKAFIGGEPEAGRIIVEEAGSFFAGGKTLEQVMDIIGRRLEMYEAERQ